MKKKPDQTLSSTQTSSANGKRLKKLRLKRVEKQVEGVQEKTTYLMKALVDGDLPNSLVIQNLIKSQRANATEIAEIKVFVAARMRAVEKFAGIPEQLARLHNSILNCLEKVQDLAQLVKSQNKGKQIWKQRKRKV
jgi:hypothetical protein